MYGGTKQEMERLLADAQKLTGVKYDINNLSDVYEAIHVIQENLGITGTTAKEASETFTGSFNSMKAAATDFLGALSLGMDVSQPMANLIQTTTTFLFGNLLPMIGNIIMSIPQAVITSFQILGPLLAEQLTLFFSQIGFFMTEQFPLIVQKGHEMIDNFVLGFKENFPAFMQGLSEMIMNGITFLMENLPQFIATGAQLIVHIVTGIIEMTPTLLSNLISLAINAVATFGQNLPQFIQKGFEILTNVVTGLLDAVPNLIGSIPGILVDAANTFLSYDWWSIGTNIISGIVNGIISAGSRIAESLMNCAKNAFDSVLSYLGIHSPSRLFRDKVGKWIPAGIAVGIEDDTSLSKQIKNMAERTIHEARLNFSGMDDNAKIRYNSLPLVLDNVGQSNTTNRTVHQTINSAKEMSPSEIAKETEDMLRRLEWV